MDIGHLFPNRGRTWILFVLLLGYNYFFYYYILYPYLLNTYFHGFEEGSLPAINQITITYRKPKYISESVERNLWITIENQEMEYKNVVVAITPQQNDINFVAVFLEKTDLAITQPLEESMLHNYFLANVPPKGVITGVFNLYTKVDKPIKIIKNDNQEKINLFVCAYIVESKAENSTVENPSLLDSPNKTLLVNRIITYITAIKQEVPSISSPSCNNIELTMNRNEAFIHSLIEILLLPPWSNGLLAVVTLIIINILQAHIPSEYEKSEMKINLSLRGLHPRPKRKIDWIRWWKLGQFLGVCISLALWTILFFSLIVAFTRINYDQLMITLNDKNASPANNYLAGIIMMFINIINFPYMWVISFGFILLIDYFFFIWEQKVDRISQSDDYEIDLSNGDRPAGGEIIPPGGPAGPPGGPQTGPPPRRPSNGSAYPRRRTQPGRSYIPRSYSHREAPPGRPPISSDLPQRGATLTGQSSASDNPKEATLPEKPLVLSDHPYPDNLQIFSVTSIVKDERQDVFHESDHSEEPIVSEALQDTQGISEETVTGEELADLAQSSQAAEEIENSQELDVQKNELAEIVPTVLPIPEAWETVETEEIQGTELPLDSAIEPETEESNEEHASKDGKEEIDNFVVEAAPVEKSLDDQEQVIAKPEMIEPFPLGDQKLAEPIVVCPVCETKNKIDRTYCEKCGYELVCPVCDIRIDSPVEYCTNCGYALDLAKAIAKIHPETDNKA